VLARALTGEVLLMSGAPPIHRREFLVLSGADATVPAPAHATWICQQMQRWGQVTGGERMQLQARESFRQDLYLDALQGAAK
jgi:hypothetical protein